MSGGVGVNALYFLFAWLISAAAAAWLSDRKGYGERVGLTFGLILSVLGLLIVLVLPARPGSKWRMDGWRPRRRRYRALPVDHSPVSAASCASAEVVAGTARTCAAGRRIAGISRPASAASARPPAMAANPAV